MNSRYDTIRRSCWFRKCTCETLGKTVSSTSNPVHRNELVRDLDKINELASATVQTVRIYVLEAIVTLNIPHFKRGMFDNTIFLRLANRMCVCVCVRRYSESCGESNDVSRGKQ